MALDLPAVAYRGWIDPYADPLESTVRVQVHQKSARFRRDGRGRGAPLEFAVHGIIKKHDADFYRKLRLEKYYVMELKQLTDSSECT